MKKSRLQLFSFELIVALVGLLLLPQVHAASVSLLSDNPGILFRDVTTDGTNLYLSGSAAVTQSIYSAPTGGGTATVLYPAVYPQGITVLGSNLYWADPQSGPITDTQILTAPKAGLGPVSAIYTGNDVGQPIVDGLGLETDGTKLYSADAVQGRVHGLNPDGSGLAQIGPNRYGGFFSGAHENYIAVGDGTLFIAESGVPTAAGCAGQCNPGIYTHSASDLSGAFVPLFTGLPFAGDGPRGIAYGDGRIYVTQGDTIYSIATSGGALTLLTDPLFHSLRGLTYQDGALYVIDNFADSGRVLLVDPAPIPLPAAWLFLATGLLGLLGSSRGQRS